MLLANGVSRRAAGASKTNWLAGTGSLDSGAEGQEIGLGRDIVDGMDNLIA